MIVKIAVPATIHRLFDYVLPESFANTALTFGVRVKVPFRNRLKVGYFVEKIARSELEPHQLKAVEEVLDEKPLLSKEILTLCQWASDYYHYSLGETLVLALPQGLRSDEKEPLFLPKSEEKREESPAETAIELNDEQEKALQPILDSANIFKVFLLQGVTGSGKTEVYLQAIEQVLAKKQQTLMLVPEISLTPQTLKRVQNRFGKQVVIMHSGLTKKQRLEAWLMAKNGLASIVIGTRSAVFCPLPRLGLIVVDEEHDTSFKQQDGLHYSARDLAIVRAKINQIPIVLGSATPSLESLHNVFHQRYQALYLHHRAGEAAKPTVRMIDIRGQTLQQGLSPQLIDAMKQHLSRDQQVLLFINRRGYAPTLICHQCGWVADCPQCDAHFTYHQADNRLRCHHCGFNCVKYATCTQCSSPKLMTLGLGSERLEEQLTKLFKESGVVRIDRDTTRKKGALDALLTKVNQQQANILLGTQMLAKGHHFPKVTLVGVIDADIGLFSTDFRAPERLGQLLIQVSGRAGRGKVHGEVLVQTRHPHHALIKDLFENGYEAFAKSLLKERQATYLPPCSYMALIRAESKDPDQSTQFLTQIQRLLQPKKASNELQIWGPIAAVMGRKAGYHRARLLLLADKRRVLNQTLRQVVAYIQGKKGRGQVRWGLDVDPALVD